VVSDFSVLHRISDPLAELDSARFFLLAERLPLYEGACRARFMVELDKARQERSDPAVEALTGTPGALVDTGTPERLRELEQMTDHPGMPAIEYKG
jgi:hypothetical protein